MTDAERLFGMAQEQLRQATDHQVFGRTKRVEFHRRRADLFRAAAHALRVKGMLVEALEKIDGDVPAIDGYLDCVAEVPIRSESLLAGQAALAEARMEPEAASDARNKPHLFVGRSGGTCYLCPHPRDHEIHPNRGTP